VIDIAPTAQVSWALTLCVAAWAAVEVPRYTAYLIDTLGLPSPYALTWLRYSLFLVLYPLGISGEIGCLVASLPYIAAHDVWHVSLPNAHNVAYSHYTVLLCTLFVLYPPGSYLMIGHMWKQRAAKLGAFGVWGAKPAAAKGGVKGGDKTD
jgi:very-long-chain (3R)-3-hydroxyacyl-CoA dehydratase